MSSESERIAQRIGDIAFLRFAEREIDTVVDIFVYIIRVMIDSGRDDSVFQSHDAR